MVKSSRNSGSPAHAKRKRPDRAGKAPFRPKPKHAKPTASGRAQTDIARPQLSKTSGQRPKEQVPAIIKTDNDDDFALIDSGHGQKLERYGPVTIIRPEGQAVWPPCRSRKEWEKADAVFTGDVDEEGAGRWRKSDPRLGETWPTAVDGIGYFGRFTAFRHVGVFAEQAAHWRDMANCIKSAGHPDQVRVLNLFGYTGIGSLYAAAHGAQVTHVDASKKAIGWARENQQHAGLDDKPIRWICEDAMKFVEREGRRGNSYDIILLDPPVYGRGPNGEVWQLFDDLPALMAACRALLSREALMMTLTAYAIRSSMFAIHEIMMETMTGFDPVGVVTSGELILEDQSAGRKLSSSMYSRWSRT